MASSSSSSSPVMTRANGKNATSAASTQVNANKNAIGRLQLDVEENKTILEAQVEEIRKSFALEFKALQARVACLENANSSLIDQLKAVGSSIVDDEEEAGEDGRSAEEQAELLQLQKGEEGIDDPQVMRAVGECLRSLFGTKNTEANVILDQAPYPEVADDITYEHPEWPVIENAPDPKPKLFRLDFLAKDGVHDVRNRVQIGVLLMYTRQNGPVACPAAKEAILAMEPGHLHKVIDKKYRYISREVKRVVKEKKAKAAADAIEPDEDEDDAEIRPQKGKGANTQMRVSRAKPFAAQLLRKRDALSEDHEYRQARYDAAFEYTNMPYHEASVDEHGSKCYRLRCPSFWSPKMREIYDFLAGRPDPAPEKMEKSLRRLPGENEPVEDRAPAKAHLLKFRTRTWMVRADLLEAHPEWMRQNRVVTSGAQWEEEEPGPDPPTRKRKAGDVTASVSKRIKKELILEKLADIGEGIEAATAESEVVKKKVVAKRDKKVTIDIDGSEDEEDEDEDE